MTRYVSFYNFNIQSDETTCLPQEKGGENDMTPQSNFIKKKKSRNELMLEKY